MLDLGRGALALSSLGVEPIGLDDGKLTLRYVSEEGRIEVLPSVLRAGKSRATVSGTAVPRKAGGTVNLWEFNVALADVMLADEAAGLAAAGVDEWTIRGAFVPQSGLLAIERMRIKAGGGTLDIAGRASASMGLGLRGVVTAMPTDHFKRLWPRALAPPTRDWVMANIAGGTIVEGHIDIALGPKELAGLEATGDVPPGTIVAGLASEGVAIGHVPGLPPILAERASLKLDGSVFAAEVPHGIVTLASGRKLELQDGRFDIAKTLSERPEATTEFKVTGEVDGGLELLGHPRLALAQRAGFQGRRYHRQALGRLPAELPADRGAAPGRCEGQGQRPHRGARHRQADGPDGAARRYSGSRRHREGARGEWQGLARWCAGGNLLVAALRGSRLPACAECHTRCERP